MLIRQQEQEKEDSTTTNNIDEFMYRNFVNALKSKTTKIDYTRRLRYFLRFLVGGASNGEGTSTTTTNSNDNDFSALLDPKKDKKMIEADIKSFLVFLREKKGLSYRSATKYLNAIKKFYYVNSEYEFKWNLIKMYLGNDDDDESYQQQQEQEDRPYTREEIKVMLKTANDIRSKIIILLMSSSGMRHGALPLLKIKDLIKIEKYNLYQITVYQKSRKHNYKTFCTPECTSLIDSYLNYRKHTGEILKTESPLLRKQFDTSDKLKVSNPKPISIDLVRYLVNEVLVKYSALRQKIPYDYENKRKEYKNPTMMTHAFRKFFDTEARKAGMYPDFVELLMGHKLQGVRSHYFKPDTQILLEGTAECKGYVAAINDLTINDENRLSKQVQELQEQDNYQKYIIDKKIKEKEEEIVKMKQAMRTVLDTVDEMRNDFIAKQNEKVEKDIEIKDHFRKVETRLFETQMLTLKLDEVDQKRQEMYAKKGFVTKGDEEAIKNAIIEDVKKNDPDLWQILFNQQQRQQEQQQLKQ
ncbi:MAG TPA: site-specific integrase [Nitrososphaeraceae archaeon]